MRRRLLLSLGIIVLLAASACGGTASAPGPSASPKAPGSSARLTGSAPPSAAPSASSDQVTKLLVFVVENHSLGQMRDAMPFTDALARRYGYTAHYRALTHPSLPNYLAIAGGDTFGVSDDNPPADHPLSGASVFGAAVQHGSTARLYADAMQTACQRESAGSYAVRHNPWAYFVDEAASCQRDDVPLAAFPGDVTAGALPAVGMVIPDVCHDAHDCPLSSADEWLRSEVGRVMAGPDWASGHLAIVITADEDDSHHGNQVLTVVAHPALRHAVAATPLNHYALARAYADVAGIAPLRHAAHAPDLLRAFGLAPSAARQ